MEPTDKMINFANIISNVLNIKLPDLTSYQATHQFIKDNSQEYWETVTCYTEPITKQNIEKIKTIYLDMTIEFDEVFLEKIKQLDKEKGIYLLWSGVNLVYIGKSLNLCSRVISSINERNSVKIPITSVSFILTQTVADMHILEPLLISEHKPILNTEFKCSDYSNHFKSNLDIDKLFMQRIAIIKNEIDFAKNNNF